MSSDLLRLSAIGPGATAPPTPAPTLLHPIMVQLCENKCDDMLRWREPAAHNLIKRCMTNVETGNTVVPCTFETFGGFEGAPGLRWACGRREACGALRDYPIQVVGTTPASGGEYRRVLG